MLNVTRTAIQKRDHAKAISAIAHRLESVGFTDFGYELLRGGSVVWWADRQWVTPKGQIREQRFTLFIWSTEDKTDLFSDEQYHDYVVGEIAQRLKDLGSEA